MATAALLGRGFWGSALPVERPVIWQTYPTRVLHPRVQECRKTWVALNPRWEARIADDDDIHAYFRARWPAEE
jgi:mannosyltransferase OCH1-like enzyme